MIALTEHVRAFLESEGYKRDDSIPFGYAGYESEQDDPIVFMDEENSYIDTDILAQDFASAGAYVLAGKLVKWAAEKEKEAKQ